MAELSYVSGARITDFSLTAATPNQIIHEIPATGVSKIWNTGAGRWHGVVRFGALQGATARALAGMLAGLNGGEHFIELPIRGYGTISGSTTVSASSGSVYDLTATRDGIEAGNLVRVGNRIYIISGAAGPRRVRLWPSYPIEVGETISPAVTIRARSRGRNAPDLPATPHWHGPWVWNWQEYIT